MSEALQLSFVTISKSILQVFFIIFIGFLLRKRRVITDETISDLANLIITAIIPCFLFVRVFQEFSPAKISQAYQMGLFAIGLLAVGILASWVINSLFNTPVARRKSIMALSGFNNSGFLPIPMVYALLSHKDADRAAFYIAFYIFFISPIMWTYGIWLLRGEKQRGDSLLRVILTPPSLGIIAGVIAALPPIKPAVNQVDFVIDALYIIGEATVPMAMLTLGAILGSVTIHKAIHVKSIAAVTFVKLILLPLCTFALLCCVKLPPLMGLVMIIQAATPPATNLAIIARKYKGDYPFVSTIILITYSVSLITLPFMLSLYSGR